MSGVNQRVALFVGAEPFERDLRAQDLADERVVESVVPAAVSETLEREQCSCEVDARAAVFGGDQQLHQPAVGEASPVVEREPAVEVGFDAIVLGEFGCRPG